MAEFVKKYNPDRNRDWNYGGDKWKLSRSKIELFVECPRCFYLDNKLGTARPRGPAFTINVAVDELFKKEFDTYRQKAEPHPLMIANKIEAVPFIHESLDDWRENFIGITYHHKETGFTVSGAVDDIWVKPDGSLLVVDYKATSKDEKIESLSNSGWEESYRRQMGVYQWLLTKHGFVVDKTGYFVYANALKKGYDSFDNLLHFETTVIPCTGETNWIDKALLDIKDCLESNLLPNVGQSCEYCSYREASGKKLMAIHLAQKKNDTK